MNGCKFYFRLQSICFAVMAMFWISGCGGGGDSGKSSSNLSHIYEKLGPYQGWQKKRFGDVVFIVSPDQPNMSELETYSKVFSALERKAATFLGIQAPDSLTIYFYNDAKHGITVTGNMAPFANESVIHFWLPSTFGQPVVKRLLPLWSGKEPKFKFLKEGIITLLDGAGENYHQRTLNFVDSGQFIPLGLLSNDTTVNADKDRYQSAMAASFVDYMVYEYGAVYLKRLYQSESSFEEAVESNFGISVDTLEKNWLEVVRKVAVNKPDSTK